MGAPVSDSYSAPGIQDEHAERGDRGSSNGVYEPTEEERKAQKLVKKLFERSKRHRSKYDAAWLHYYRMFRGKQWTEQRPSFRHSEVINLIFTNIQGQVPLQTDSRPRISFVPQEPSDLELTQILNDICESDWERNAWLMELTSVIYDAHFYGIGYSEEGYDAEADLGAGSATYFSVDPVEMYPDPDAININDTTGECRSEFFIRAQPYNVDKLKAKYPDKADYIKADLETLMNDERTELKSFRYRSPTDNLIRETTNSTQHNAENNMALLITCYVKDNEIVEEMVKCLDEQGNETEVYEQRKKYPNGRRIKMVGEVILEDGPNPFADGEFPYSKHVNYMLPREYYGISEVENLESPQKIFNKLVSFALDVLTLMGNPIWIVPQSAGIDTDSFYNRPGAILEPENSNHGIQRQEGVQLQPYVFQLINSMQEWFDTIGGTQDITRGVNPTGVSAASAISQLQDAAQTRIRLKMRNLDAYLKSVGRHWLSRVLQFYSVQRVYRVTNKDGTQKWFKFSIADKGDGSKVARIVPYLKEGGMMVPEPMREIQIQTQFDVQVQTGSSLPFAKAEKEQRAYQLFDRGIIDAEEVMNVLDYPNAKAVLERVKQRQAEEAQMQQQQAAAGGK